MDKDSEKWFALEGVRTWGLGTIRLASACDGNGHRYQSSAEIKAGRAAFEVDRHLFLIAAHKLVEYANWAIALGVLSDALCRELHAAAPNIKRMRDLNEHKLEYFRSDGKAQKPHLWVHQTDEYRADASATVMGRIGGLVDWNEVSAIAQRLLDALPDSNAYLFRASRNIGAP